MVWSWDNIGSRFRNNFPSFVHVSLIVLKLSKDESICFFYFFGLVYFTSLKGLWLICSLLIWCYLGPNLETINIIDLKVSLSTMIKVFDCVDHIKLWKILQEMGIPDHLTCLLRNLYAGQETTVRTGHGTTDWFQIGKGVRQGCILSSCLNLTYMKSTSWETLGWRKHKLESRLPGEISITSDMQMTPPYGRKWRGTKEPLDESERGEWKSWLKAQHSENEDHGIRSHYFMANRWGNSGNSGWLYFSGLQNYCRW